MITSSYTIPNSLCVTEDGFISFFKDREIGACFEFYTTGTVLIETDIWKLTEDFLKTLEDNKFIALMIFFKHSKDYKNTWQKYNSLGTFPAVGGLKSISQVLELINTKSLHFIMED